MDDSDVTIDGWRCYVAEGSRCAVQPDERKQAHLMPDGALVVNGMVPGIVPAPVVRWLMAADDDRADAYAAISKLRQVYVRYLGRHDLTDVLALNDAFQALPCPQCRQTGWAHKMDCSQGDLERVAAHPRGRVHVASPDSLARYGTDKPSDPDQIFEEAEIHRQQVLAWEALMRWSCATIKGEKYKSISCNDGDSPVVIAEWGVTADGKGYDDGAMAVAGKGKTYGEAAYKLACMLGIQR